MNYYNEFDHFSAEWLRELIKAGHLPKGDVDERSICDIQSQDLKEYTQCHFFAGIGGWSLALKMANWPTTRPVWTGSCPCQPFSLAGRKKGLKDERHLWPVWYRLIAECKPSIVFGEQVASAISDNWLDIVSSDLESEDYAVGAAVFTAACAGAPHIRDRLYWVGYAEHGGPLPFDSRRTHARGSNKKGQAAVADSSGARLEGPTGKSLRAEKSGSSVNGNVASVRRDYWETSTYVDCTDGARRPIERGTLPFSYGFPQGMGRMRGDSNAKRIHGYGNAIVPPQAALFIEASYAAIKQ